MKNNTYKTKLKVGDVVQVISGNKANVGKTGKILAIDFEKGRVQIEGVAPIKRHLKPQKYAKHPEGGLIEDFGTVHLSNVMIVDEEAGRPVRLGHNFDGDKKVRVSRGRHASGKQI